MTQTDTAEQLTTIARTLSDSGMYGDWRAVCWKMLFDGHGIHTFNNTIFRQEIDALCTRARAT
jgi:hypothetical protein